MNNRWMKNRTFVIQDLSKVKQKILKSDFWEKRVLWAKVLLFFILAVLWSRFFYLQVIKHSYYVKKAKSRSVVTYTIKAPRGNIITTDGVVVATNKAVFNLYIDVEGIKDKEDEVLYKLSKLLKEDFGSLKERFYLLKKTSISRVLLKSDLQWDEVAKIMVRLYYLPGVSIEVESERYYPYGEAYFHLIGYVSKINREEYLKLKDKGYSVEDLIGRQGLEKVFEEELKGKNGYVEIERDAYGRLGRVIARTEPIAGNDLILTINHNLQLTAYELLKGKRGAIVALSPSDGSILAMVSAPSVDPQKFIIGFTKEEWQAISSAKESPFLNKALRAYPPGSTYKVITALTALRKGVITNPSQSVFCPGYFNFGTRTFKCWEHRGHGTVGLIKAIAVSCDVYFYTLGTKLDVDDIASVSKEFGLGQKALGWPEEDSGLIPDREWKKRKLKQDWFQGETVVLSIGQGYLLVSPIQLARLYMVIANGGFLYRPYVVKAIQKVDGTKIEFQPVLERKIEINPFHLEWIRQGLIEVVRSGTARSAAVPGIMVAGKTGTAQVVSLAAKTKYLEHHAWFVSYAGKETPEIVSTVFVEHGGHGGGVAAPLARELYKVFFKISAPPNQALEEEREGIPEVGENFTGEIVNPLEEENAGEKR
jgi:penicillin-binding protein 2